MGHGPQNRSRKLESIQGCQMLDKEYGKCLPVSGKYLAKKFDNGNVIVNIDVLMLNVFCNHIFFILFNVQYLTNELKFPLSLSLLVVRRFDDGAAQRVSLCRHMWLLSPKAEAPTRPHTVQVDPCRVVVGCGWLRCWCLRARFATATSICCCSKVARPLSQTARHYSRSPANSSSLSKGIPHLLKDDLM